MASPGEQLRPSRRGLRAWRPNAAAPQCPPAASGRLPCAHSGATGELKTEEKIQQLYQHVLSSNGVARGPKWGRNVQAELHMDRVPALPALSGHSASLQTAGTQLEELQRAQHISVFSLLKSTVKQAPLPVNTTNDKFISTST